MRVDHITSEDVVTVEDAARRMLGELGAPPVVEDGRRYVVGAEAGATTVVVSFP
jgi:hypothetical protein